LAYRQHTCSGYLQRRMCNPYRVDADKLERAVLRKIRDAYRGARDRLGSADDGHRRLPSV
ncbi:MAG: hypothetical protein ACO3CU_11250, partial [Candidatus Nanopelagicales bacterium]